MTAIIDALVSSPEFQSLALERAKKARETTTAYLAQEKDVQRRPGWSR